MKDIDRTNDFEQRLVAFHGGKPLSEKVVLEGVTDLEYSLTKRFNDRVTHQTEAADDLKKMQAPIYDLIANNKLVAEGLQGFQKMNARLGERRITPPPSPASKIAPRIMPGSILSVLSTPYDYQWTSGAQRRSGFAGENAQKTEGTALVYATGNSDGSASASAGIGKYFRPISENAFVRFTPLVKYNYFWYDRSTYLTAHNDGYVGVFIQSFDLNGGDRRTEVDIRPPLWSDGTSWFQDHRDEQDGTIWPPSETVYFPATSNRQYIVWVWCNVSCDDNTNNLGSSYAVANLGMRVNLMFFEQYT